MKNTAKVSPLRHPRNLLHAATFVLLALAASFSLTSRLYAADVTWTMGSAASPSDWNTVANWDLRVPLIGDNAVFNGAGTNTGIFVTNNGVMPVGSITWGSGENLARSIYNNNSAFTNTLTLNGNGTDGRLIANLSSLGANMNFGTSASAGRSRVGLATSGEIYVENNCLVNIYSPIVDYNGSHGFTKTGVGSLYLRTNNTFTGSVTISAGDIQVNADGTFGIGTNTLYLNGGAITIAADRSGGLPIPNPVVMSADTTIQNLTGLANSARTIPFNGSWTETAGTLTLSQNSGAAGGNVFRTRFLSAFNFSRPIVFFSSAANNYVYLQLYNSVTNGDGKQTFSANISDSGGTSSGGVVWRSGAASSPGGTTIFTGNNTYSGGTYISYGTLCANNTAGSGLGSGQVTVTNQGVLGGSGYVVATTRVSYDNPGGTVSPGSLATNIGKLNISDLTLGPGATYIWQIQSVTANAGVNQDQIACSSQWTDAATSGNPVSIKLDSMGTAPTGWNSASAYDWVLIQSSTANGFDSSHFTVDASSFGGILSGGFSVYVQGGSLHLSYTTGSDFVINVPSGSQGQTAGYGTLTGSSNVVKVGNGEIVFDNSGNTYSGLTKVLAGTLSLTVDALNGSGALGANSSSTLLGNTTGNSNATLNISVDAVTDAHNIIVQAGSSGTKTIGTTLTSGTANFAGDVALNDSASLTAPSGGSAVFSGNFSGNGGLSLGGGGTLTMSGVGSYAGPTTIGGITLNLGARALGTNAITISSGLTLDNTGGGSVTLNDAPYNWNANFTFIGTTNLNLGNGAVTMSANRTLTINSNILTVGGAISGNAALTKLGAGTLSLQAATNNTYTGPTTNAAGVIEINNTATFGIGTNLLVLSGGDLYNTSSRGGSPIANPVLITANTRMYGKGTLGGTANNRYLPFSGPITATSGALYVDNLGVSNNYFVVRLVGDNFTNINFPIVVGDAAFDNAYTFAQLDLANSNTAPTQFVNSVITGPGIVRRAEGLSLVTGSGGTTVFNTRSTYSGGTILYSGTIGFGTNSVSSGGVVTSGPIGTGTFTIGGGTSHPETALGIFAYGGARVVENDIVLNGNTNIVMTGTDNLTFTGPFNAGGIDKTLTVQGAGVLTISGQITNTCGPIKAGTGTLVFSGDNLYANATTVLEGKLLVNNTSGSGTSTNSVAVQSAGTLGGSGSIAGPVVVTGGNIAPGNSAGTLTLAGGVDLSSGGTYVWELGANSTNNPGTDFDVLAATGGSVVLGGTCKLSINFTNSATVPDSSNPFWRTNRSWKILTIGGSASNPGPTKFPTILNGTYAAGSFTNYADAGGNIILRFVASAAPPLTYPKVTSAAQVGTNLVMSGSGGPAGHTYYLVSSANVAALRSTWVTNATSAFDGSGNFIITNAINPADPQRFFSIKYIYP